MRNSDATEPSRIYDKHQFKISPCTENTSSSLVWYLATLPKQHFAWKFILQFNGPKPGD